jgi:hypothetical protein
MSGLRRTEVGSFSIADAQGIENLDFDLLQTV